MAEADLRPMSIREAVECAKIFIPHIAVLRKSESGVKLMLNIYRELRAEHPVQVLRALALMEHRTPEQVAEDYHEKGAEAMVGAFARCLAVNPLPDLIQAAYLLGLTTERWTDG